MPVKIKGFDKVKARINRLSRTVIESSAKKARREMEQVITAAKKETPVDTGALRSSGRAENAMFRGLFKYLLDGSFGSGPSGKYALFVHEGLRSKKGKSGRSGGEVTSGHKVGKSHFLIDPFKRAERGFFNRMAKAVGNAIRKTLRSM